MGGAGGTGEPSGPGHATTGWSRPSVIFPTWPPSPSWREPIASSRRPSRFAARGFRDTTRVAASDPVVWQEIFHGNRGALLASLRSFRDMLDEVERLVVADDVGALQAWLAEVKALRETVR